LIILGVVVIIGVVVEVEVEEVEMVVVGSVLVEVCLRVLEVDFSVEVEVTVDDFSVEAS